MSEEEKTLRETIEEALDEAYVPHFGSIPRDGKQGGWAVEWALATKCWPRVVRTPRRLASTGVQGRLGHRWPVMRR